MTLVMVYNPIHERDAIGFDTASCPRHKRDAQRSHMCIRIRSCSGGCCTVPHVFMLLCAGGFRRVHGVKRLVLHSVSAWCADRSFNAFNLATGRCSGFADVRTATQCTIR